MAVLWPSLLPHIVLMFLSQISLYYYCWLYLYCIIRTSHFISSHSPPGYVVPPLGPAGNEELSLRRYFRFCNASSSWNQPIIVLKCYWHRHTEVKPTEYQCSYSMLLISNGHEIHVLVKYCLNHRSTSSFQWYSAATLSSSFPWLFGVLWKPIRS